MILLAGVPHEGPLARVRAALDEIGAPHVLFDQSEPETELPLFGRDGRPDGVLRVPGGTEVAVASLRAAYTRMLDHTRLPAYQRASPARRGAADGSNAALLVLLELLPDWC